MQKMDGVLRIQSKQWLAALAASLAMINVGNAEFWISKALKNARDPDSVSESHSATLIWIGLVVATVCIMIGAILGAVVADWFGRRKTLLITSVFTIGQIIGYFITNDVVSCVSLFLGLIGLGLTRVAVPLYISEIVDDDIRGTLMMLQLPFFYIGKLIAVGIGHLVSAEIIGVISLILTIIFLIAFTWLPETPYYLASKKDHDAATRSIAFYRGMEGLAAENRIDEIVKNDSEGCCAKIRELVQLTNRKGLLIIMFLIIIKWSEGIFDIRSDLWFVVNPLVLNEDHTKIIINGISLITSILIMFTIDVIGRRSFLLYSNFVGFVVVIIALIVYSVESNVDAWVADVISVILYFCQLISLSVPLVYVGELFTPMVNAPAIAITTIFDLVTNFIIILMPEITKVDISSFIGSRLLLVSLPVTFAFIPETKRKSFSDIQSKLATTLHCRWLIKKFSRTDIK